ncbi:MAG: hypothetical protein DCC75_11320 [Proteobacteria bacterium]|nr:MAG: hypothetical protein DCC75_11320 [Pseudomonadota bacterium]
MARAEADYRLREYYSEEFAETCYAFCESPEAGPGCEQWCDGEIDNMEEDSSNQYNADVLRCNNLFPQIMRIPPWIRLLIPLLFPGGGGAEPPPGGNA